MLHSLYPSPRLRDKCSQGCKNPSSPFLCKDVHRCACREIQRPEDSSTRHIHCSAASGLQMVSFRCQSAHSYLPTFSDCCAQPTPPHPPDGHWGASTCASANASPQEWLITWPHMVKRENIRCWWGSVGLPGPCFPRLWEEGTQVTAYVRTKWAHTHGVPHSAWPGPITTCTRPEERETWINTAASGGSGLNWNGHILVVSEPWEGPVHSKEINEKEQGSGTCLSRRQNIL